MKQRYKLGTSKYISPGENFRRRFKFLAIFLAVIIIAAAIFSYDFYNKKQSPKNPVSKTTLKNINFEDNEFSTPYFKFRDSEKWNFIASQSSSNKFVFQKYLLNSDLVQHQLIVYVDSTPAYNDLASSRVLPVGINSEGNGFIPEKVSDHCGKTYGPGEVHRVLPRQVDGATLLCDPEQGQFRVVISKKGADYNLNLKRSNGAMARYIIIYQNQKLDPDPETIMRIARSFQAL
jgi:hypothetical protein